MGDTENGLKQSMDEDRHLLELIEKRLRQINYAKQRDVVDRLKQFLGLKHYGLWQWEELNRAYTSIQCKDSQSLPRLSQIVTNPQEPVWFLFDLMFLSGYPVYEGTIVEIEEITKERNNLRCYIIAKDFSWLVAKNHRNEVIAIGEDVERNLNQLRNENAR